MARKGKKKVRYCASGNKSQITIVGCVNAIYQAMPPFIIFDAKNLNMDWTENEVPGTTYGLGENGWIDMELFKLWFINHFQSIPASCWSKSTLTASARWS